MTEGANSASIALLGNYMASTFIASSDGLYHIYRAIEVSHCLESGVLICRWMPDQFLGYGTPLLNLYSPAVYYVITGKLGVTACMLWLANFIFAGNQIHYVQLRIHTARVVGFRAKLARGWAFASGQLIMTALLATTCVLGWMSWIVLIAFAPLVLRGFYYFVQGPAPLVVRRLGWNELAQAVSFCFVFVTAFSFAR